jgi:hypothetical protein
MLLMPSFAFLNSKKETGVRDIVKSLRFFTFLFNGGNFSKTAYHESALPQNLLKELNIIFPSQ